MPKALIIGAGLAGATCAYLLRNRGWEVVAYEKEREPGGLSKSSVMNGVVYEPHGSHIFHTDDREVWELVNNLVPFWRYEHSVITMVRGQQFTWPIQEHEVREAYGDEVADRLLETPNTSDRLAEAGIDFESWCLGIMPSEIYEDFVQPYTEKQWGVPAWKLSAEFAPKRVQVRTDGDKRLFKDAFQGFPDALEGGTYAALHDALWGDTRVHVDYHATLDLLRSLAYTRKPKLIVVTVPLDDLCGNVLGELPWRGLRFQHKFVNTEHAQDAMVVNWPSRDWPFIRTHETKHASRQNVWGTVLTTEFTGATTRYYPVPGRDGSAKQLNRDYQELVRGMLGVHADVAYVGRLSTYRYQDQDEVIRDAIDAIAQALDG